MSRETIRARVEAADKHISDLCSGKARWTMRVPAEPDRDSDLVLSAALADVERLLAVADAAVALMEEWDELGPTGTMDTVTRHHGLRAALAALDEQP